MIRDALDKEMMSWWEQIKPARGVSVPPQTPRVEVSITTFTKVEKIPQPPKQIVINAGTNANVTNNANV